MEKRISAVSPALKIRLLLLTLVLFGYSSIELYGQGHFTLGVQSGYRFPLAKAPLNTLLENSFMSNTQAGWMPELLGSFGSGSFGGLSVNYASGKSLEYGLQFSYCHFGKKTTHIGDTGRYDKIVYEANTQVLAPILRLNIKVRKITPYLQFGLPLYWLNMTMVHQLHSAGGDEYFYQTARGQLRDIGIMFGGGVKKTFNRFQVNLDVQATGFSRNVLPLSNTGVSLGILWKIN